jgi:hypothetical protein
MLSDWIEILIAPCPSWAREMGYLRELLGIRRRYREWRSAWQPHCERSRQLIRRAIEHCRQRRKAVVLGSGWLLDVPLAEFAASFREVILVDLLHPLATRWRTRRYPNVVLLAADVSGTAEAVWRAVEERSGLPRARPELFVADTEVDLVVSLNLLSQLPCIPEQYVRRAGTHSSEEITAYCRDVVQAHLDYLRRLPGVVTLIADFEARTCSSAGALVARHGTLYGVEFPFAGERWDWPLVPRKRSYPHHAEYLSVAGIVDIKEVLGVDCRGVSSDPQ